MPFDGKISPVKLALIEGREAIKHGWCQGVCLDEETGAVCMTGALGWRGSFGLLPHDVYNSAYSLVANAALGDSRADIANWNDNVCRTKAEVLAVFDAAIAKAS